MEPKIEPWIIELAKEIVEANADRGRTYDNAPDYLETAKMIAERVPSSPAPRLEFQADRMTETEWSADTWLVLPNGKRDVLGWIPCDSQDDADREVATLKKLYAEAVPSSPAAPLDDKELIDKFERAAASADLMQNEGDGETLIQLLIEGRELVQSSLAHVSHGGPTRADAEAWLRKVSTVLGKMDAGRQL